MYCLIFAKKEFAKDIIEKIVFLFASIEKIKITHQLDLHMALKMMIKYQFKGDDKKIRELLTMITKTVHESKTEEIPSLEQMKLDYEELQNEFTKLKAESLEKDNEIKNLTKILVNNGIIL